MNYLAHFYLSGTQHPLFTLGNFLGDFVKGKKYQSYPSEIQKGILFHRAVDTYTDEHPLVLKSKKRLFPRYHHYSAVLVDLFYDHLLAADFQQYSSQPLADFAAEVYALLEAQQRWLPEKALFMLPYMKRDNWLLNYGTIDGIGQACAGIARRTRFNSGLETGPEDLQAHYKDFQQDFQLFFSEIQAYTKDWIESKLL
ncbi:acyl carrier protein phosphodiesterase [Nafulsella turpanensis]|uniref:acyl carrier protein phosphodiesterase n=1 Tax=Nafulsella turpanensis TaxID=1265690 RepID=UPI000349F748|nr:acyl carrier protein phosphodiesterase [Nafulsella turpanensis]